MLMYTVGVGGGNSFQALNGLAFEGRWECKLRVFSLTMCG